MSSFTTTDLLTDFRKILELFDKETKIYKEQLNILNQSINELQTNDANRINEMSRELGELRVILTGIEPNQDNPQCQKTPNNVQDNVRNINDYLCQICLDKPRDCILEPCMHFSLCNRCVKLLPEPKCPICRRTIEFFQNVFIS